LAARPIGAYLFGRLGDRYGRKPILMLNILSFSLLEAASGLAPTMATFLLVRFLFGIAMGGEWGLGAALTFETIPVASRGVVSGLLQGGYPTGFLLATLVFREFYDSLGWRWLFLLGAIPSVLVLFIWRNVEESPAWLERRQSSSTGGLLPVLARQWKLVVYAVVLMTCFNFFSHGSQDAYPNFFLKTQHGFSTQVISAVNIVANIGAILGGLAFGLLSQRIGRRRTMTAAALLVLPMIPFWAFASGPVVLAIGAFFVQVAVQGAWGIIPVHLNEISPPGIRATFPGVVYQLGNLLASVNLPIQVLIAQANHDNYGLAMAIVVGTVAVLIALMVRWGPERHSAQLS
jgi:SHS family lactate transporter-like MFS transporter